MKTEEGLVIEVSGETAKVKTGRHNDCKNCGACPGDNTVIVCAKNQKGALPGQRVVFELKETNTVMAAFIVFIFPLISVFLGAGLGWLVGQKMGGHESLYETFGGVATFMLSILYIKIFNNNMNESDKYQPKIIQIL